MSAAREGVRRSEAEDERRRQQAAPQRDPESLPLELLSPQAAETVLQDPAFRGQANASRKAGMLLALQESHGNTYVQRLATEASREPSAGDALQEAPLVRAAEEEDQKGEGVQAAPEVAARIAELRGGGQSLPRDLQTEMAADLGGSLEGVRVHAGREADALSQAVDAAAFTAGRDVFFREGRYEPDSRVGRELLAHELTHVLDGPPSGSAVATQLVQRQAADTATAIPGVEGNPVAPVEPGRSSHPTVRTGSGGPAVEELQQKLNGTGASPELVVDGVFGPKTRAAVVAFQEASGLARDGVVGPLTWAALDLAAPGSTVGRVERPWHEIVGGQRYEMVSRFTQRLSTSELVVEVKLRFVGLDPPGLVDGWFGAIRDRWNRFDAVKTGTTDTVAIRFNPVRVTSGADNTVRIHPGSDRADAGNWYVDDPDGDNTAGHEFGHMIGLEDEYQRTAVDYARLMGEVPATGVTTGDAPAADIARELHTALHGPAAGRGAAAQGVVTSHNLQQGSFAQLVAVSYQAQFAVEIVQDIVARLPDAQEWDVVDPFTFSSSSLMGSGTDHDHPVEARHVREFVAFIQASRGGVWEAQER